MIPIPNPGGTITRQDKAAVVQPCGPAAQIPADPVVDDQLNCIDIEKNGVRQFRRNGSLLEIVQTGAADTVVITYSGPVIPPQLNVSRDGQSMPPAKGGGKYSYEVGFAPPEQPYLQNGRLDLETFISATHAPTVYTFSHPDLPRTIEVHVYNPDQWSLAYDPPPAKGYSLGAKLDNQDTTQVAIIQGPQGGIVAAATASTTTFELKASASTGGAVVSSKTEQEIKGSVSTYTASLSSSSLYATASGSQIVVSSKTSGPKTGASATAKALLAKPPLSLKRNGALVEIDFIAAIGVLISLKQSIQDIITLIRTLQSVKMGWYVDLKADFFDGKFQADWGWREDASWEAYYYTALLLELKIFSVNAEIGVGVEVGRAGAQICAGLSGELAYGVKPVEVKAPSSKPTSDLSLGNVTGTITAGVYARVKAGSVLTITAAGQAPLKVSASIALKAQKGLASDISIAAEGLVVSFQAKGLVSFKPKTATLIEGGMLGNFSFPGPDTPKAEDYSSETEIATAIQAKFDAGWWPILFYDSVTYTEPGLLWGENDVTQEFTVGSSRIAKLVAAKIWSHREKLDLSSATVDGLAHTIRKASEIMGRRFGRDKVSVDQMRGYLEGPFVSAIQAAYSPAKLYRLSLTN